MELILTRSFYKEKHASNTEACRILHFYISPYSFANFAKAERLRIMVSFATQ